MSLGGHLTGAFAYFCSRSRRLMLAGNGCRTKHKKGCGLTQFQYLKAHSDDPDGECVGWGRTVATGDASTVEGPWQVARTEVVGFLKTETEWHPDESNVSTAIASCSVPPSLGVQADNLSSFCLGGWGDARSDGLCPRGYLQHPRALTCTNGTLNLLAPPAALAAHGDEGWWCADPQGIGALEHLDELPPFYFVFLAGLLKIVFTLVAFGPPKPGIAKDATSLLEKGKLAFKLCLQCAMLVLAIGAFASDMLEAWAFARAFWAPEEIEGHPTRLPPWFDRVARAYLAVCVVFCNSGINGTMASVTSLKALYNGHFQMEFAHEGERIVQQREKDKDPVPVAQRHGLENAYALAGHKDFSGDVAKLAKEKEGLVMSMYMMFLERVCAPIYIIPLAAPFFVGGLLYCWICLPMFWAITWIANRLSPWAVDRAEAKKKKSQATYSEVSGDLYEAELPELQDDDAVFYMMLDFHPLKSKSLTFTKDVSNMIYADSAGGERRSATVTVSGKEGKTDQSFAKGATIKVTCPVSYEKLCKDPDNKEKRFEIAWTIAFDNSDKPQSATGFVPVDAVVPTLSREEARELYAEQLRAYHYTGTTTFAWDVFFLQPLVATSLWALAITLGVRFLVLAYCWPLELTPQSEPWGLGGAYVLTLTRTLRERTLLGYARPLMESSMKGAFRMLELVNLVL